MSRRGGTNILDAPSRLSPVEMARTRTVNSNRVLMLTRTMVVSHGPVVIVDQGVANGDPIGAISCLKPRDPWDSGLAVWSVPHGAADDVDSAVVCLECLLEDHPEVGRGMDLAREHGEAIYDGSDWISGASSATLPPR